MNFTDNAFYLFFIATFAIYYLAQKAHWQLLILVVASLFFYTWHSPSLLAIFLCSWFITSLSSYGVLTAKRSSQARVFAAIGIAANLGILGFFKYKFLVIGNLFASTHQIPATVGEWLILAPLPIGISFYTFHGISLLLSSRQYRQQREL